MQTKQILKKLERNTGKFPRDALREAVENREKITPELLRILRDATETVEQIRDDPRYMAHIYAIFLLAQFRETQAYPLVAKFFSLPGEAVVEAAGEGVTDLLDCILASICGGDSSRIERLIENPETNESVRSASVRAMLVLVAAGAKTRDEVLAYYKSLFTEKLDRSPSYVWGALVRCAACLYPDELYDEISKAFEDYLVSALFSTKDDVDQVLERDRSRVLESLPSSEPVLIEDVIEEMEWWTCFEQNRKKWAPRARKQKRRSAESLFFGAIFAADTIVKGAASRDLQGGRRVKKVGRNDPCPCRSGKKYKKCCLRTGRDSGDRTVQHPVTIINAPPAKEQEYQVKITLCGSDAPIWRRVLVLNTITLAELHWIIQKTMGWDDYHAHDFVIDGVRYGIPSSGSLLVSIEDEKKVFLGNVVEAEGREFLYRYDFGDNWLHQLILEKVSDLQVGVCYPVCLDGERACPPEDCGGMWGYCRLLEAANDRAHPEHEDSVAWLGRHFDPEAFSAKHVNSSL
jgi:hypothetical protein